VSTERSELDHAIDALRDQVEAPLDGGAATEAAILRALRRPPPWWKTGWKGPWGGVGLVAVAVGVAVFVAHRDESPAGARDGASRTESTATAEVRAVDGAPTDHAPIDDAPIDDAPTDDAPTDEVPTDDANGARNEPLSIDVVRTDGIEVARRPSTMRRAESTPSAPDVPPIAAISEPEDATPTADAAPTATENAVRASLSSDEQRTRFRDAHRLQYTAPLPAVLEAWDRFLRDVPTGPFADEARYYRALSLGRLGRVNEAREALEAIAAGRHGERHRVDAARVLRQLAR
jgi:hypothetical protein